MNKPIRISLFALSLSLLGLTAAAAEDAKAPGMDKRANFVACPMVRNTFVPCWMAQHEGELYYLGPQGDLGAPFRAPQLRHRALIEGVVSDEPRICGGIVLKSVNVSVLPELDDSCNTILPAEGYPDPPHHRTPGPSNSEREERQRTREEIKPPFTTKSFDVMFEFDVGQRLFSRDTPIVTSAARYAAAAKAKSVEVVGYRGGALLSSGERMMESEEVGKQRAEMVKNMLVHAGVQPSIVRTRAAAAEAPDGIDDFKLRRATIVVTP
jgi:outer membrane protein OmpA-like peptidoglycan-associated protein